jgi:hypothetical protein
MPPIAVAFVRIRPDDTGFSTDTRAKVRAGTRNVTGVIPIRADTAPAQRDVDALRARIAELAAKAYNVNLGANDKDARAKLAAMAIKLDKLNRTVASPDVKISGIAKAEADLLGLEAALDRVSGRTADMNAEVDRSVPLFVNLAAAGAAVGPAVIPVMGATTAAVTSLGVSVGAAGGAFALFAAVSAHQLTKMVEDQKKLETAFSSAASKTGAARKKAMESANAQLAQFKAQYGPAADAYDRFLRAEKQFTASAGGIVNTSLAKTLDLLTHGMPIVTPLLRTAGQAAVHFEDDLRGFEDSGGLGRFVAFLVGQARPAFDGFELDAHNIGMALSALSPELAKLGLAGSQGLTQFIARMSALTASRGPEVLNHLLTDLHTEGPQVAALFKALAADLPALVHGLAPLAPISLALSTGLARLIADLPPGAITAIAAAFVAWSVGAKALAAKDALGGAWQLVQKLALASQVSAASTAAQAAATEGLAVAEGEAAAGSVAMTASLEGLTVAETAAAAAAGALDAALAFLTAPVTLVVGGAAAVAGLTFALLQGLPVITSYTDRLAKADKATGFNVEGYRKLAAQTTSTAAAQGQLRTAIESTAPAFERVRIGAAAYAPAVAGVAQVHAQATATANRLDGALSTLQGTYGLTRDQAEQLAVKAGVTAEQLAASGTAGQDAYAKIVTYADGVGKATVAELRNRSATEAMNRALNTLSNGLLTDQGNLLSWRSAQNAAAEAIANSTSKLKGNSDAAIAARQAVLSSTQAAIALAKGEGQTAGGVGKATAVIQSQIRWLQTHAGKSKFAAQEVLALRDALRQIKSESATITVHASGEYSVQRTGGGPSIRNFAGGGRLAGYGGGDRHPAMLESGETVVSKEDSRLPYMRAAFTAAGVPGYAAGGVAGNYTGNARGLGKFDKTETAKTLKVVEAATAKAAAAAIATAVQNIFGSPGPGGGSAAANAALARRLMPAWGSGAEWAAWNNVAMRESGWNQFARNPSSGAYGIPQALPASKMGPAANPPSSNPTAQIRWMIGYIQGRYRDPIGAWNHELTHGWYARGSKGTAPGWGVVGERGPELMYHPAGGATIIPHAQAAPVIRGLAGLPGYAAGAGPGPIKTPLPVKGKRGKAGESKLQRDRAELERDQKLLAEIRKAVAKRVAKMRQPIDREELFLLNHPGLSASRKKALRATIAKQEAAIAKYRGKQSGREGDLEKKIAILKRLVAGDPKPGPHPPGPVGPIDLGTKKQRLAELARIVAAEAKLKKQAAKRIAAMRVPLEKEELYLLTHPGLSRDRRASIEADIKRREKAIAKYRAQVGRIEDRDDQEIKLLRALTGNPADPKYGGGGDQGGGLDGGGGDLGGGGDGGGGASTGAGGTPAGPVPSFLEPFAPNLPDTAAGGAFGQAAGNPAGQATFGGGPLGGGGGGGLFAGGGAPLGGGGLGFAGGGGAVPFAPPAGGGGLGGGGGVSDGAALAVLARIARQNSALVQLARRNPGATAAGVVQGVDGVGGRVRNLAGYATR